MTGAELAQATGLSEATVSRLASGERKPSVEAMKKIESALGWSITRQLDALDCKNYASAFKSRMERRAARVRN
jgi:transcriptional regulator with XRE-family HTH domain